MFLEESQRGQLGEGQLGGPEATPSGRHAHPGRPLGGDLALLSQCPDFSPNHPRTNTSQKNKEKSALCCFSIYLLFHASEGNSVVIKVIQFAAPRGSLNYFPFSFKFAFSYFILFFPTSPKMAESGSTLPDFQP